MSRTIRGGKRHASSRKVFRPVVGGGFAINGLEGSINWARSPDTVLDAFYGKGNKNYTGPFQSSVLTSIASFNATRLDALITQLTEKYNKLSKLPNAAAFGNVIVKLKPMLAQKQQSEAAYAAGVAEKAAAKKAAAEAAAPTLEDIEAAAIKAQADAEAAAIKAQADAEAAAAAQAVIDAQLAADSQAAAAAQKVKEDKEFTIITEIYRLMSKPLPDRADYDSKKQNANVYIQNIATDLISSGKFNIRELLVFNTPIAPNEIDKRTQNLFNVYLKLAPSTQPGGLDDVYSKIQQDSLDATANAEATQLQALIASNKAQTNTLLNEMDKYSSLNCGTGNGEDVNNPTWNNWLPATIMGSTKVVPEPSGSIKEVPDGSTKSQKGGYDLYSLMGAPAAPAAPVDHPEVVKNNDKFSKISPDETWQAVLDRSNAFLAEIKMARNELVKLYDQKCQTKTEPVKGGSRRRRHKKRTRKSNKKRSGKK